MNYFEIENVCYSYYRQPLCLKDVSFSVARKQKVLILGSEGSGKTTLLKVASSFDDKYCGKIFLKGKNIKEYSDEGKNLSLILSEPVLIKGTIRKNIDFLTDALKIEKLSSEKLQELLNIFKIPHGEQAKIKKLSRLEKLELCLLRAYIKNPAIVFVDDIFVGLAEEEVKQLYLVLFGMMRNLTTILACGDKTFKNLKTTLIKENFDKIVYLSSAKAIEYKTIDRFLCDAIDLNSMDFIDDYKSESGFIFKAKNEYYFTKTKDNIVLKKFDKFFYNDLNKREIDELDYEDVLLFVNSDQTIYDISDEEMNKFIEKDLIRIYSKIDGARVI